MLKKKAFGVIAIGPPGSGKSTFCHGLQQLMSGLERKCAVINLDPANDNLHYAVDVDVSELISVEDAMDAYSLGPNGGLVYCMEFLEKNFEWLRSKLIEILSKDPSTYLIFDAPGQVELFTHNLSLRNIIYKIVSDVGVSLCTVQLVDISHCSDPARFISILLLSMKTMLHLELPHVNVLSKIDLLPSQNLSFNLDFYTEVQDLSHLLKSPNDRFMARFQKLNEALIELIEDFNLVSFYTLFVEDKESMYKLLCVIDRANGWVFGAGDVNESILETAIRVGQLEEQLT